MNALKPFAVLVALGCAAVLAFAADRNIGFSSSMQSFFSDHFTWSTPGKQVHVNTNNIATRAWAQVPANLGVQTGSVTTSADETVTNTFSPIFSAAPALVIAQMGKTCTVTNSYTVTKSNFVYTAGAPSIVAKWIAVGTP